MFKKLFSPKRNVGSLSFSRKGPLTETQYILFDISTHLNVSAYKVRRETINSSTAPIRHACNVPCHVDLDPDHESCHSETPDFRCSDNRAEKMNDHDLYVVNI